MTFPYSMSRRRPTAWLPRASVGLSQSIFRMVGEMSFCISVSVPPRPLSIPTTVQTKTNLVGTRAEDLCFKSCVLAASAFPLSVSSRRSTPSSYMCQSLERYASPTVLISKLLIEDENGSAIPSFVDRFFFVVAAISSYDLRLKSFCFQRKRRIEWGKDLCVYVGGGGGERERDRQRDREAEGGGAERERESVRVGIRGRDKKK